MHKFLFYYKFIIRLYMFRALCAHHQEVKLYYTASVIVTICRWPSSGPVHGTATYRCDDTRCCTIQFDLLMISA